MFKAVVVRSGAVEPPSGIEGGNILDLMQAGISNSYLILHGESDNAVSVENARAAVGRLQALGIDHKYIEIEEAAHGGYEKWEEIFSWIRQKVKGLDAGPRRKPSRKRR
jgi:predicted esterase